MTVFLAALVFFYFWYGMGIAIGYHRLSSHKSFKCSKLFEYFWVFGGYVCYQGSPIWWSAMHRAHHKHVDTPLDPHSPRFGIYKGYFGWIPPHTLVYPPHIDPKIQCKDLFNDPLYRFLEQGGKLRQAIGLNLVIAAIYQISLGLIFGWPIAAASTIASVIVFQVPLLLNVGCHIPQWGYKSFANRGDDSVNVWWLAVLAHGEGWHNNHHAHPGSAKSGILPHEFDLSWEAIKFGKLIGLVSHANVNGTVKNPPVRIRRRPGSHARLVRRRRARRRMEKTVRIA